MTRIASIILSHLLRIWIRISFGNFLKIIKDDTLTLLSVIKEIRIFLEPVLDEIVNEEELQLDGILTV